MKTLIVAALAAVRLLALSPSIPSAAVVYAPGYPFPPGTTEGSATACVHRTGMSQLCHGGLASRVDGADWHGAKSKKKLPITVGDFLFPNTQIRRK
ncbi:hypothetical protein [Azospirillum thiophilum]|uniref:hypothetical protein n=1 Tax=Azospirillum thiophilum TaxID=528244 RepID=UPI000A63024C|nr:hypothetical protein [Azospirillum thiophilum]